MLAAVAVNVAFACPAVTATLPGSVILALLLERVTMDPPAGATLVSVTVQAAVPEAITVAGAQAKELTCTVTDRPMMVDWVTPLSDAVTVTFCALGMFAVLAANVAVLWLAATVTLAGTVRAALPLFNATVELTTAALFNITVHVLDELLPRARGAQDSEESMAGAAAARVKV
jgi:hypothetical protein